MSLNQIELAVFSSRLTAVCDEMGAQLKRAAFSPNIRDRLDYSCAVFDSSGELCAQAAHIPVHLGSMAYAMRAVVSRFDWKPGDAVIFNDPYLGGTHLPDVTVVQPIFERDQLAGFAANRAHHADIGAETPGSMPLSTSLSEEGLRIPPRYLMRAGRPDLATWHDILDVMAEPRETEGDLNAQLASVHWGVERASRIIAPMGLDAFEQALHSLNDYAERLAINALQCIPKGEYRFCDVMDDDGLGTEEIEIAVTIAADGKGTVHVNFNGTHEQVPGNINCPLSVTAASVFYAFRCLMPSHTPACAGSMRPIELSVPEGCLLNAEAPAAVAAGNVETSQRIVDVLLGALSRAINLPAASYGSMNNLAMGARGENSWSYYETIAGGIGGGPDWPGLSAVQAHMTNTLNTPVEVLEQRYPVRLKQYRVRRDSGGEGRLRGGDGVIREYEFLKPARATLIAERRRHPPWGLNGGLPGAAGRATLNGRLLPGKCELSLNVGDRLLIETPGGGGCGKK